MEKQLFQAHLALPGVSDLWVSLWAPRAVSFSATSQLCHIPALLQAEIWGCINPKLASMGRKHTWRPLYLQPMCPLQYVRVAWRVVTLACCAIIWTWSYSTSGITDVTSELSSLNTCMMYLYANLKNNSKNSFSKNPVGQRSKGSWTSRSSRQKSISLGLVPSCIYRIVLQKNIDITNKAVFDTIFVCLTVF